MMVAQESEGLDLTPALLQMCSEGPCGGPFLLWILVYHLYKDRFGLAHP